MSWDWLYREDPPRWDSTVAKYAADGFTWDGIDKVIDVPAFNTQGTPMMLAVDLHATDFGLSKMAAAFSQDVLDSVKRLDKIAGDRIFFLGSAMGSDEFYGSNKNADAFPRMGLMNDDPDTYGFKTFAKHAWVYPHHKNKDPKESLGKVEESFWDEMMDKVLCLASLIKDKAPHLVARLEEGGSFPLSMGCKCPWDVCSICNNKAPTRAQYCQHLKLYPNQVLPDGRKVKAVTPHPRFFDLSAVLKGADPTAHALQIVDPGDEAKKAWDRRAKHHPMYPRFEKSALAKTASAKSAGTKSSTITKEIPGMGTPVEKPAVQNFARQALPVLESAEPKIDPALLNHLGQKHASSEVLSSFAQAGIVLRPEEFTRIILAGEGRVDVADAVDRLGIDIMKLTGPCGELAVDTTIKKANVRSSIYDKIAHLIPERSGTSANLYRRTIDILSKVADVREPGQNSFPQLPPGTKVIIISTEGAPPAMMERIRGMMAQGSVPSLHSPNMPGMIPMLLAAKALYGAYRTNLGQADVERAFDPDLMQRIEKEKTHDREKRGSDGTLAGSIQAMKGVPSYTYFKFAYLSPWGVSLPDYIESTVAYGPVLMESLIARPLEDSEKVATILASGAEELVDAATAIGLRFAGGALKGALYRR